MRMKEYFEDKAMEQMMTTMTDKEKRTDAFFKLCQKTNMLNREIAEFLQIPERSLYRYLSGTSRVPPQLVKLLTLKLEGVID